MTTDNGVWSEQDIIRFLAPEGHMLHLSTDPDGAVQSECTCGEVAMGFTSMTTIYAYMQVHCQPL